MTSERPGPTLADWTCPNCGRRQLMCYTAEREREFCADHPTVLDGSRPPTLAELELIVAAVVKRRIAPTPANSTTSPRTKGP